MIPVVLSGGMGTRLWPLSRAQFPKQFCELLDESLLEKTLKRVKPLGAPWTLTVRDLESLTLRAHRSQDISAQQILFEPFGRNTAPAIALLCRVFSLRGWRQETVAIFPADHLVLNEPTFLSAISLAKKAAENGFVATLGIRPSHPETGFGYIETQSEMLFQEGQMSAFAVAGFREKPSRETAEKFLRQGNFFWNAGMFVFQIQTMVDNFKKQMPELWKVMEDLREDLSNLAEIYNKAPAQSIDYGIMEHLKKQVCIPCDIGWTDLGSWDDVARFDEPGGSMKLANQAQVVASSSKNCFVYSPEKKVYGLVDVDDVILVDTPDALLLVRKGRSQNVRAIVEKLNDVRHSVTREHRFEIRPWGRYTILRDEPHFKSKVILVDPQSQISYQSHTKRAEHWIIVRGAGEVTLNEKTVPVSVGDAISVPTSTKHRIRNTGTVPLEFVEVQTGTYFGEDDITRYQDDYNRK